MKIIRSALLATFLAPAAGTVVHAQDLQIQTDKVLTDQWFTGPLVAPSPALPKAGMFVIEPYNGISFDTGKFLANGHHVTGSNQARTESFFPLLEYAVTDRLSIQTVPEINYAWNSETTTRGLAGGDTPIDLKYRFVNIVPGTAIPAATVTAGISIPTGPYDKLGSSLEETGTGVWNARQGITLQWLVNTYGNHPLRVRLWGELEEPLNNPTVQDLSVYGTQPGFRGTANPGITATFGISPEYGLTRRWVLAADIVENYQAGPSVNGFQNSVPFNASQGASTSWSLAPAVEYNFTSHVGVIAGVQFSIAGHNTSSYVEPQVAVNIVF